MQPCGVVWNGSMRASMNGATISVKSSSAQSFISLLPRRQVVRHLTLDQAFVGSNPAAAVFSVQTSLLIVILHCSSVIPVPVFPVIEHTLYPNIKSHYRHYVPLN